MKSCPETAASPSAEQYRTCVREFRRIAACIFEPTSRELFLRLTGPRAQLVAREFLDNQQRNRLALQLCVQ